MFHGKISFDMTKVLPLNRWKKDEPRDHECFSVEDPDKENFNYEDVVIPKKKQAERMREFSEAVSI